MSQVLLPNVLQSLPVNIPQAIRQFAKQLEPWLTSALEGLPSGLCIAKLLGNYYSNIIIFKIIKSH